MLSPKATRNLLRILPFGLIWLVSGWVFLIVEYAAVGSSERLPDSAVRMDLEIFIFSSVAITGVGLLVGLIELLYLDDAFSKKSFSKKIFYKLLVYTILLSLIVLITFPVATSMELDTHLLDRRVWMKYTDYLTSPTHLSTVVQLGVALGASLFYAEISDNIGHRALINFFTGKYHAPVEEERIFMFLDMKSSTTIAEQLGHLAYFRLLKQYYADLSDAVVEYGGDIYQYVGDEMVISWPYRPGITGNDCIRCFFAMKEALRKKKDGYQQKFGVTPAFKAGLHYGKVTTGEIGVIKKQIHFSGDVLNAASRIQGLCNTYGVDLLLSADLADRLPLAPEFRIRSMGEAELRGRKEHMELFTVL